MITDNLTELATVTQAGGGLKPGDWINAISAIFLLGAIIVSLFIGLRSLRQTQAIQKAQERDRLLNELDTISEWAQNLIGFTTDIGDNLLSIKDLDKLRVTGGSIKRQYSGVFSSIVDSEDMRNTFNILDALKAFLNSPPSFNLVTGYEKVPKLENELHTCAENILIKADNSRNALRHT